MSFFGAIIAVHKYNRLKKKKKLPERGRRNSPMKEKKKAKKEWEEKGNRVI